MICCVFGMYIVVPPLIEFTDAVIDVVNDILIVKWKVSTIIVDDISYIVSSI